MANIRTLKSLYQPISSAATKNVMSSVDSELKKIDKEHADRMKLMSQAGSLASKLGKDIKSFKLAKKGGFGVDQSKLRGTTDYTDAELAAFKEKGINVDVDKTHIQKALDMRGNKTEREVYDELIGKKSFGGNLKDFFAWKGAPDLERKKYHKAALEGQTFIPEEGGSVDLLKEGEIGKLYGSERYKKHGAYEKENIERPAMPDVEDDDYIPDEFEIEADDSLSDVLRKTTDKGKLDRFNKENLEYFENFEKREAERSKEFWDMSKQYDIDKEVDNMGLDDDNPLVQNIISNAENKDQAIRDLKALNLLAREHDISLKDDKLLTGPERIRRHKLLKTPGKNLTPKESVRGKYKNLETVEDVQELIKRNMRPPMPPQLDTDDEISDEEITMYEDSDFPDNTEMYEQYDIDTELDNLGLNRDNPLVSNILSNAETNQNAISDLKGLNILVKQHDLNLDGTEILEDKKGLGHKLLKTPGKAFTNPKLKFRKLETMDDVQAYIDQKGEAEKFNKRSDALNEAEKKRIANEEMKKVVMELREEERIKADKKRFNELRKKGLIDTDRFGSDGPKFNTKKFPPPSGPRPSNLGLSSSITERLINPQYMDLNMGLRNIFKKGGK